MFVFNYRAAKQPGLVCVRWHYLMIVGALVLYMSAHFVLRHFFNTYTVSDTQMKQTTTP